MIDFGFLKIAVFVGEGRETYHSAAAEKLSFTLPTGLTSSKACVTPCFDVKEKRDKKSD